MPDQHGIVGNGWFFKDLNEIGFWKQSNKLVQSPCVWDLAKKINSNFTCAQLFWWYNMYGTPEWSVTPRPLYPADGRKIPDIYSNDHELRHQLNKKLGLFPLFQFWGPATGIKSSKWIADCALYIHKEKSPTLNLVYIPHLDYCLQRYGPDIEKIKSDLKEVDSLVENILDTVSKDNVEVIILSEYGVTNVNNPIHLNRILRSQGLLQIKKEFDYEMLDAGASAAFAVCDHQIAHIYIKDKKNIEKIKTFLSVVEGIEEIFDEKEQTKRQLFHERSGDLLVIANESSWFTYYFWNDDKKAPDYARTVDIHRKPGYDPVELFIDPKISFPKIKILSTLAKKKIGMRSLMDLISLDATLVKGSHGRRPQKKSLGPILMTNSSKLKLGPHQNIYATEVSSLILKHIF